MSSTLAFFSVRENNMALNMNQAVRPRTELLLLTEYQKRTIRRQEEIIERQDVMIQLAPLLWHPLASKEAPEVPPHFLNDWGGHGTRPRMFCCTHSPCYLQSDLDRLDPGIALPWAPVARDPTRAVRTCTTHTGKSVNAMARPGETFCFRNFSISHPFCAVVKCYTLSWFGFRTGFLVALQVKHFRGTNRRPPTILQQKKIASGSRRCVYIYIYIYLMIYLYKCSYVHIYIHVNIHIYM